MNLTDILPLEAVIPNLSVRDKKQALKVLSAHAARLSGLSERDVFSILQQRENVGCTGMGKGVCIPHGRFPHLKALHAVFARLEKAIEFGAADGKPVDLVFLLLTPSGANTEHLKALATMSRLLRDQQLCQNLRSTTHATVMHDLLLAAADEA